MLSIEEFAAEAPRLTEDQRARLATLLRPAREHLTEQEKRKRR